MLDMDDHFCAVEVINLHAIYMYLGHNNIIFTKIKQLCLCFFFVIVVFFVVHVYDFC